MMSDSKMHYLLIILECEHIPKNPEDRVCLSRMQKRLEYKRPPQKAQKKFFLKALFLVFRLLVSTAITFPYAIWAVEYADIERGYKAHGGEFWFIDLVC
ncbi:MAG: hypothetical protein ACK5H4_05750, partial [Lacrimispora sphenoides]